MSTFNRDHNRAVWFDIPVADLERAAAFYRAVLGIDVHLETFGEFRFAVLDHHDGNGGCLVIKENEISSDHGILVYLNVHGRIRDAVAQVTNHGGKILTEIQSIGPHGFRAIVLDSEGNRLALHSDNDE
ncbi:MAG: VOC family protein [Planctomycetaceae bacterium]